MKFIYNLRFGGRKRSFAALPYEIELILYAAPLVTQQANLMPVLIRMIFSFLLSLKIQYFCKVHLSFFTKYPLIMGKM